MLPLINFQKDWLSTYFVFIIILIFIPVAIYTKGYIMEYKKHYSVNYMLFLIILFVASMIGVVVSNNAISFLVFWEMMSISSFFLVVYEYMHKENLKAGIFYFVMTHISGLFLMIMFAFLYKYSGSFDFNEILKVSGNFQAKQKYIIFILALFGFGAKMGIVPLHAWLPKAHPTAPSNVSALMSGVMLKVALYGFIRVIFIFLRGVPLKCGVIVIIIGTITAIFSILNALLQNNIKKLLAYSSAENVGLIFAALGMSMILINYNLKVLASLALTAALLHCLNHAIFKSLLFLNAGSVLYATGTKNMNELGGLHREMKFTTICTFIATCAISAVPPFNGFASEILILRSFIESITKVSNIWVIILIFCCGVIIAITSGAAFYATAKSFGITFLGKPRTKKAEHVKNIPISMNIGQGLLAMLTIVTGIFSPYIINKISYFTNDLLGIKVKGPGFKNETEIIVFTLILISITFIVYMFNKINSLNKKQEISDAWACGFTSDKPYIQYTGSGFVQPAAKTFGPIANYNKKVSYKQKIHISQTTSDVVEDYFYKTSLKAVNYLTTKILKINYGKIQLHILYIFISVIIALVLVLKFV
ncbi:proton-conducting transporter transmembrane domain-containing protein [Clostridium estertheticum]|uniref:proton-conducting transporter transmembrane domain-containing protein n=1 Tax=Clostridium estertheticum TaxID=238834 RepID=UPI0027152376|nr:proton-conducting transporter membrane subunit [Clostridium estertheticum]